MDAVLRVDDELRPAALLDPFIDSGRTVTVRWSGKNIVLGCLLQFDVGDPKVNRLVLLVVGIGQEYRRQLVEGELATALRWRDRCKALRRIKCRPIRLAVAERPEQREAEQRVHPHVEAAEADTKHRAELRP